MKILKTKQQTVSHPSTSNSAVAGALAHRGNSENYSELELDELDKISGGAVLLFAGIGIGLAYGGAYLFHRWTRR